MDTFMFSFIVTMLLMSVMIVSILLGIALITKSEETRKNLIMIVCFVLGMWILVFGIKVICPEIFIPSGGFLLVAFGFALYREFKPKKE